jgi:hypothetical protein
VKPFVRNAAAVEFRKEWFEPQRVLVEDSDRLTHDLRLARRYRATQLTAIPARHIHVWAEAPVCTSPGADPTEPNAARDAHRSAATRSS